MSYNCQLGARLVLRCVWDGELRLHADMSPLSGHICGRVLGCEVGDGKQR